MPQINIKRQILAKMPTITEASVPVNNFPNLYTSPFGNDCVIPLYSSIPLKTIQDGCLECVVCGNTKQRQETIANSSSVSKNVSSGIIVGRTNPTQYFNRILLVGGGGASYADGLNQQATGGGGGGQVVEILQLDLISGVTYEIYVGTGGGHRNSNLAIFYSGKSSTFGIVGQTPIYTAAGGNYAGPAGIEGQNPVTPYTGGGEGEPSGYNATTGSNGSIGGAKYTTSGPNSQIVFASGGGAGAGGTNGGDGKGFFTKAPYYQTYYEYAQGGAGGMGYLSQIVANTYFGGGGGGTAYAYEGGGNSSYTKYDQGVGGLGGGGSGSQYSQYLTSDGKISTGGGAGGCNFFQGSTGVNTITANGGSGIVHIQIPLSNYSSNIKVTGNKSANTIWDANTQTSYIDYVFAYTNQNSAVIRGTIKMP